MLGLPGLVPPVSGFRSLLLVQSPWASHQVICVAKFSPRTLIIPSGSSSSSRPPRPAVQAVQAGEGREPTPRGQAAGRPTCS
jgi:hypothetical protein